MPDPFGALPVPIPLMILDYIDTLPTLHYLLEASPCASIVLSEWYCEVIERIMMKSSTTYMKQLLLTIAHIRTLGRSIIFGLSASSTLGQYIIAWVPDSPLEWKNFGQGPSALCEIPLTFSKAKLSYFVFRSILASAAQIQQTSASFFNTFLDRVNSIKPSYLQDQSFKYTTCFRDIPYNSESQQQRPVGCRYTPAKCGAPSWVEEQRVHRALWRLQLYFDLVNLSRPDIGQASPTHYLLRDKGPCVIWSRIDDWQHGELECVYDFLCKDHEERKTSSPPKAHLSKLPTSYQDAVTLPKSTPNDTDYLVYHWRQHPMDLDTKAPAAHFWVRLSHNLFSPL